MNFSQMVSFVAVVESIEHNSLYWTLMVRNSGEGMRMEKTMVWPPIHLSPIGQTACGSIARTCISGFLFSFFLSPSYSCPPAHSPSPAPSNSLSPTQIVSAFSHLRNLILALSYLCFILTLILLFFSGVNPTIPKEVRYLLDHLVVWFFRSCSRIKTVKIDSF